MIRKRGLMILLVIAFAIAVPAGGYTYAFYSTHSVCYDDTGQQYFSNAPPGSALPCGFQPAGNEIVRNATLFANGTFQFILGDGGASVSFRSLVITDPGFATSYTTWTQVTTTCDGCSSETFTYSSSSNLACVGLSQVKAYSYTSERCNFSGANVTSGQDYDYVITFSDSWEVEGQVTAQN